MILSWLKDFLKTDTELDKEKSEIISDSYSNSNNIQSSVTVTFLQNIIDSIYSATTETLEHIIYACLVYLIVCLGIYKLTFLSVDKYTINTRHSKKQNSENVNDKGNGDVVSETVDGGIAVNGVNSFWRYIKFVDHERLPKEKYLQRVLLVTSHPDDECMFFGPLIYSLTRRENCNVYILCLSNGNFEGKSQLRREELWHSCERLGVPSSNIILINATNLPDDPNVEWKTDTVANIILNKVESLDIQALFTFDRDGVSQHPNHCALYFAAASLCLANLLPKDCKFYTLDSINIFRKYISIFDLLCTCVMSTNWCILSWHDASIIRRAMCDHKSQMKWFRWLYIYFSRYMFINSMREVNLADVELEMQIHDN